MALLRSVRGISPTIDESCWLAESASLIGDVHIAEQCSIWYQTVLRGDVCKIVIGKRCNIQDGVIIHGTLDESSTTLADDVSIGHGAILHGCYIDHHSLIGMRAIVLDHVHIEPFVMVAAGALVPSGKRLESGWIYAGLPAKKWKKITPEQKEKYLIDTPKRYVEYSKWYQVK